MTQPLDDVHVEWEKLQIGGHVFVPCIRGAATRKRLRLEAADHGYRVSTQLVLYKGKYGVLVIREL